MKYVNVVIDNSSKFTDTFYTYTCNFDIKVGDVVKVPFNRGNNLKTAYVFEIDVAPECELNLIKEIDSIDENISLNQEIVDTICWMRTRYGIKYIDGIKCFIPNGKIAKTGKEKEPYKDIEGETLSIESLTEEQANAIDTINEAIDDDRQENFLIHGVTSSGKTEVYMRCVQEALNNGKTAIMLVPEIALTTQIINRFIARFGKKNIAVLHSKLTKRERFDEWLRIKRGEATIVIGARIGVFAPLENIGIIILDEEHEATYKSDMTPKYDTVDVAVKRLMFSDGVLVLGSATPSVVSYQRVQEGIYTLIELKKRYNETPLPKIQIVDMREELKCGNKNIFSNILRNEIEGTLKNKQQVILFLNRRGYSTFVSCRECGHVMVCPECNISLTYHKKENSGICHYCGKKFSIPKVCPECKSTYIKYFGSGTEQVEEFTREQFPGAVVDRLDLDTAKNSREISKIIGNFSKGKTNILIGTQLVAKGLDFKNVGLVGVVSADVSLNIPDYRSAERTFQLVTQVSGRAGRGTEEGNVVVQSYTPDNFALVAAAEHDYEGFFHHEILIRKFMEYPPFSDMIVVSFTSLKEALAYSMSSECKQYLINRKLANAEKIFEPKISYSFKGKDSYRYNILIKAPKGERNKYVYYLRTFGNNIASKKISCTMTIDVNPYGTL